MNAQYPMATIPATQKQRSVQDQIQGLDSCGLGGMRQFVVHPACHNPARSLMRTFKWPVSCSARAMITRFFLILASLATIGLVGAFLIYVSLLSLLAAFVVGIGLLTTLVLGYWAGSISVGPKPRPRRLQKLSVINSRAEQLRTVMPIR